MATKVGTVEIDVDVGTAKLQEGWNRADAISRKEAARIQAQAVAVGSAIGTALGNGISAGITGLINQVKKGTDALAQLGDMSEQFGLSVQTLSALRRESTLSGASFDQLGSGIRALSVAASTNNSAFKAMGISVKDGAGNLKSTETLLDEVAKKFAGYEGSAAKAAIAQKLFGDQGVALIPLLDQIGSQGLAGVVDKTKAAGAAFGDDAAAGAKQFSDDLHKLQAAGDDFSLSLAAKLLPSLNQASKLVTDPEFQSALDGISTAIAAVVQSALDATEALTKMYNAARGGVGVGIFNNGVNNDAELKAAQEELAMLQRLKQQGGAADVLGTLANSWNPGEIAQLSSVVLRGTGARNDARQSELQSQIAAYLRSRPTFAGVTSSYVGTVSDAKEQAPMIPQKTTDHSNAIAAAAQSAEDAQRRLADLTERLQGQVAGPATQAWDAYAKAVRDAADAGAKQIEAAEKQVALGDKSVDVAQVTASAQDQVAKAVDAARAAFEQYRKDADRTFNSEMADVEASISKPTKALTEQAQALRNYQKAIDSLDLRKEHGQITATQYDTGVAEYKKQLDARVADIERASDQINQFELEAARNIQDQIGDTFYDMYTDIDDGLDGILESWGQLLLKMISQAQAAQVAKALFGDYGQSGQLGGLAGAAINYFTGGSSIISSSQNYADLQASTRQSASSISWNANGNAFAGMPGLSALSGKVYNSPQVWAFANGAGVLGEAGAEAVMPLKRGADGKLGVRMAGAAAPSVGIAVNITNNTSSRVTAKQGRDQNGMPTLEVLVDQIDAALADRVNTGRSRTGNAIAARTGTSMATTL